MLTPPTQIAITDAFMSSRKGAHLSYMLRPAIDAVEWPRKTCQRSQFIWPAGRDIDGAQRPDAARQRACSFFMPHRYRAHIIK